MKTNKALLAIILTSMILTTGCNANESDKTQTSSETNEVTASAVVEVTEPSESGTDDNETTPDSETVTDEQPAVDDVDAVDDVTSETTSEATTSSFDEFSDVDPNLDVYSYFGTPFKLGNSKDVAPKIFDKFPEVRLCFFNSYDFSGDGVDDYIVDTSNADKIEYRFIDGATMSYIDDAVWSFDYIPNGGIAYACFGLNSDGKMIISFVNRELSVNCDENNEVNCYVADNYGNKFKYKGKAANAVNKSNQMCQQNFVETEDGYYEALAWEYGELVVKKYLGNTMSATYRDGNGISHYDALYNPYIDFNKEGTISKEEFASLPEF